MFEKILKALIEAETDFKVHFGEYGELDYVEIDIASPSNELIDRLEAIDDYIRVEKRNDKTFNHQITLV